jgi:hypothetical protein
MSLQVLVRVFPFAIKGTSPPLCADTRRSDHSRFIVRRASEIASRPDRRSAVLRIASCFVSSV